MSLLYIEFKHSLLVSLFIEKDRDIVFVFFYPDVKVPMK